MSATPAQAPAADVYTSALLIGRQYPQQIIPTLPSGASQFASAAIQVYWADSNRRHQLASQLQRSRAIFENDVSSTLLPSPELMRWVLFGMIAACYLLSRTDWTVGLLLRKFSSFMFP